MARPPKDKAHPMYVKVKVFLDTYMMNRGERVKTVPSTKLKIAVYLAILWWKNSAK